MNLRFIIRDGQKILQCSSYDDFEHAVKWEDIPTHDPKGNGCPECKAPLHDVMPWHQIRGCTRCKFVRKL